ncbi:MAG: fatty acid CoA ligase family protein [Desulfobacterales bacterium]|nr:fatty acid CoA ligase family protein [Desulfobacterales bacterium]MDJ0876139.1 fatty acid CoA ligase family protein [Desulfobacterales bacterium]
MPETIAAANAVRVNIAHRLRHTAARMPYKRAVVCAAGRGRRGRRSYSHLTFEQLDRESDNLARGLDQAGIRRGTKTVLMVKPGIDFFVLIFALFKVGAVPVVVDPGMGIRRMLRCLESTTPEAFIGIPLAHVVRVFFPRYFRSVRVAVTVGRRLFWGGATLASLGRGPWQPYALAPTQRDETAAILFTTGSTGPAKGVVYTHGNFDAQIQQIQDHFAIGADEIDLPTFPLFALFDPALGMTAVIPDMDPRKPAQVDPNEIIGPIVHHGVTNMFASPALLNRVGRFGRRHNVHLPSLRRVVSAGAPVSPANIDQFAGLLSETAEVHTPYGATEAVPIVSIGSREILSETRALSEQGYGMCVGRPLAHTRIRIIRISDEAITDWDDDLLVPPGEIGEIVVQGHLVTRHYYDNPRADALAKIVAADGFWHRMGDLGWQDSKGRLWFCGRKNHRVVTPAGEMYTIPCEAIFNNHSRVFRSALVGVGNPPHQEPVICIERHPGDDAGRDADLEAELLALAAENQLTATIQKVLFHPAFPVDIRHNAKIFREKLAIWAAARLRR